jgi:hypothetical protein
VLTLAAIAGALACGLFGLRVADDAPGCLWKWVTGIDCPFCGMTHATVALGAGDWSGAHAAHPLAIVVLALLVAAALLLATGRAHVLRPRVVLVAVLAIWAVRLLA